MQKRSFMMAGGVALVLSAVSFASFVQFYDCVQQCTGSYWRRVAWTLDCELELAHCTVTAVNPVPSSYYVVPDPEITFPVPLNPTNPNPTCNEILHVAGTSIPFNTVRFQIDPNYVFGASGMVNDQAQYLAFKNANIFNGPSNITSVEVKALTIEGPNMLPDDPGESIMAPAWASATTLYNGPNAGMALNTTGLAPGMYILRTRVVDTLAPNDQFGLSNLELRAPGVQPFGWEINTSVHRLDIDGVQATRCTGAIVTRPSPASAIANFSSQGLSGQLFEIAFSPVPTIPLSLGAVVLSPSGGTIVNLNIFSGPLTFQNGGSVPSFAPTPGSGFPGVTGFFLSIPFTISFGPQVISMQGIITNPASPLGFDLTQATELDVM